jgi:hypothetical protein
MGGFSMATVTRSFKYSFGSWGGKLVLWLLLSTVITSMLLDFPNSIFDMVEGVSDNMDLLRVGGAALIILLISSYAVNLYPNVSTTDSGLLVDYFWTQKHVPWENIVDVVETGSKNFKSWAVEVTRLTLLHRFYGQIYLRSSKRPCFVIFSYLPDHGKLIEKINKEIKKRRPR